MATRILCLGTIVWMLFYLGQQHSGTGLVHAYIPIATTTPQNVSGGGLLIQEANDIPPQYDPNRWGCFCYNKSAETQSECSCFGVNLYKVPQDMPLEIERLTMVTVGITTLRKAALKNYTELSDLIFNDLPKFRHIEDGAFQYLTHIRTIYISNAPNLQNLSAGTFKGISRTLKSLRIVNCGLIQVPNINHLYTDQILTMVDLEGNRISRIEKKSIMLKTEQLILANNDLVYIGEFAFYGSSIARLSLKGNSKLVDIHKSAFGGMVFIQELDLSTTNVVAIPTVGLDKLEVLRIENTQSLKIIPSVYNFKSLQEAWLTHPFHCCAFIFPSRHDPENYAKLRKSILIFQEHCQKRTRRSAALNGATLETTTTKRAVTSSAFRSQRRDDSSLNDRNMDSLVGVFSDEFYGTSSEEDAINKYPITEENGSDEDDDDAAGQWLIEANDHLRDLVRQSLGTFHNTSLNLPTEFNLISCGNLSIKSQKVKCYPKPDALNPCEDVMGSQWLRASVWIVVSFTVLGNVSVLVVILSSRSGVSVFKFLISNLAFADLCMGLYLLLIASMDIHSIGEYFNFAFDWQYGLGCKTAGFLTVFASTLSVYTLTVITIERWLTITYAIYLNKRIKLRTAIFIMIGGWAYSIIVALLPLFGFSNYSSTSICLPMESRDWPDISYLLIVLLSSGLAFIIIAISYSRIYFSLGRETRQAEVAVAKKMILLVFTNFACWAPIAFFALTALAGYPLIDVAKSKILLVFFYPLNSCANPYLYAIITVQYRKDLFSLLAKCGLCAKRAQKYKLSYSIPTVNNTLPLMGGSSSNSNASYRKSKRGSSEEKKLEDSLSIKPIIGSDSKTSELTKIVSPETEF